MGLTAARRDIRASRKERLEELEKRSEVMTVMEASVFIKKSVDFCYNHWKDFGGTVRIMGSKKAIYVPIEKFKLMRFLDIKEKPKVEVFLDMTPEEKKLVVLELLPYIRENLFK